MNSFEGFLIVDKPTGWTSRKAVDVASRWFPRKTKIGHTGTLDPLATGVLVICVGSATRIAEYVQAMPKTYRATIRLGAVSDTDDAEGVITETPSAFVPALEVLRNALRAFLGEQAQIPPIFSAVQVAGVHSYDRARRGENVELAARKIHVYGIELLRYEYPDLDLEITCGKGTYIRSLARDLGTSLACGGYLTALRRMRVGSFFAADAVPWQADPEAARQCLLPLETALGDLPTVRLTDMECLRIQQGQRIPHVDRVPAGSPVVALLDPENHWFALAESSEHDLQPTKVFRPFQKRPTNA